MIRIFVDLSLWIIWYPLRFVVQAIPLRLAYRIATSCAHLFYLFPGDQREIMAGELQRIFRYKSSGEINRIVKESFEIYFKRQVENLIYGKLTKRRLEKMVSVEGGENLNAALKKGKGAIILLSHFGSFLLILPALAYRGYRINQLAGPPMLKGNRPIHQRIFRIRRKASDNLPINFLRSDQSLSTVFKSLKNNECIAIAFDGREGGYWIPVKMLDSEAFISPGALKIAMKTGASIIPTFIVREKDDTQRVILESIFELEESDDKEKMVFTNTGKVAAIFERYIQRFPSHYGMVLQIMRERADKGIIDKPFLK